MNEAESEATNEIKLFGYIVEFHGNKFKGVGFAFLIGKGIFYKSIRVEITIPLFTCGFHIIKDVQND